MITNKLKLINNSDLKSKSLDLQENLKTKFESVYNEFTLNFLDKKNENLDFVINKLTEIFKGKQFSYLVQLKIKNGSIIDIYAVNEDYIVSISIYSNRTDIKTISVNKITGNSLWNLSPPEGGWELQIRERSSLSDLIEITIETQKNEESRLEIMQFIHKVLDISMRSLITQQNAKLLTN